MTETTRDQLLNAAEAQFAARGFYGTSIAQIADELSLTKQALLHHFGNKEKLYGEVLRRISEQMQQHVDLITAKQATPRARLEEYVVAQLELQLTRVDAARLLMRELLDNEQRAQTAGSWYLQPYLDLLVSTAQQCDATMSRAQALSLVYQLLGAAHYFSISLPTLREMFGKPLLGATRKVYARELRQLIRARLA